MPPELRREEERTRRTKYEGPEPSKKRITKKRSGKQPAKRKRQQGVNQADKPIADADKAVEAAQQLVAFKKFTVARQNAAKAVSAPVPAPAPAPTSPPNRPPPSAQPPRLEPEDLISSVADIPEPTLPTPPAPRRAIHRRLCVGRARQFPAQIARISVVAHPWASQAGQDGRERSRMERSYNNNDDEVIKRSTSELA
jgi:hypothetical protein